MAVSTGAAGPVTFSCLEEDLQWAGASCSEDEPCSIYLELSAVASAGRRVFVSGNLHTSAATLNSLLLASDDNGLTWLEPVSRMRGNAIEAIAFHDAQYGWAAGETQYPLARDPFFLITSDGGHSWHQKAVLEEGSAGAVIRFDFDSPQYGQLVIDAGNSGGKNRYWSYESHTSGESWNLTGKSERAPAASKYSAEADLRIRTSVDGQQWLVEQRSGERWNPFASFPVEAAVCRGETSEPAAPPETEDAAGARR